MAKPLHWIIPIANELGYFPTAKQATEINCRAGELYAAHFNGRPPRGPMVKDAAEQTLRKAIDDVMSRSAKTRRPGRPAAKGGQ